MRGGASRSNDAFAKLAEDIENIWDEVVGLPSFQLSGHPAQTHPQSHGIGGGQEGEEKGKEKEGNDESGEVGEKGRDWSDGRRLQAVYIVPGLVARESGLRIPDAGGERQWLQANWGTFQRRAAEGDDDMRRLIDEVEGRGTQNTDKQNAEENGSGEKGIPDRTIN